MISSAIARLTPDLELKQKLIQTLSSTDGIELGPVKNEWDLPLVICAENQHELESQHRWIDSLEGVETLHVVFVHFEEIDDGPRQESKNTIGF